MACGDSDDPSLTSDERAPSATSTGRVEPQVLQDVISAAFEVPGNEMRRAIRLLQFLRDKGIQECGGEPASPSATYNREDQSRFPDLGLIRQRGLTEQEAVQEEDARLDQLSTDCMELEPDLEHYDAWRQAQDSWYEQVLSAEQSPAVQDQKPELASCLTRESGLEISAADPVNEFLQQVNLEVARGANDQRTRALSIAYADCAGPYFAAMRRELLKSRTQFIDRNRETLRNFTAEVVAAGYVP